MAVDSTAQADAADEGHPGMLLLLTVEEAARRLRLGRTLVYRLIASGELESVKVGRLRRIPADCLPAYIATLRPARDGGSSVA